MYVSDVHGTTPFTQRPTPCKKYGLSAAVDQRFSDVRLMASLFAMCIWHNVFWYSLCLWYSVSGLLWILFRYYSKLKT